MSKDTACSIRIDGNNVTIDYPEHDDNDRVSTEVLLCTALAYILTNESEYVSKVIDKIIKECEDEREDSSE